MKHRLPFLIGLIVILGLICGAAVYMIVNKTPQPADPGKYTEGIDIAGSVVCDGTQVSIAGTGLKYKDGVLTVEKSGAYLLEGELDGYVLVKGKSEAEVTLVLNGFSVTTDSAPAIYGKKCARLTVLTAEGTENSVTDSRTESEIESDEIPSSIIFCKTNLIADGSGRLTVTGNGDCFHSKETLIVNGGEICADTSGDGFSCDQSLIINGGKITVKNSDEGLEGKTVEINGGDIDIVSDDDGINATDGSGRDLTADEAEKVYVKINGGSLHINASGDGIDSNGGLYINGGNTYVEGPEDNGNGILDYSTEAVITGGTFVGIGSSGMFVGFGESSTQGYIANFEANGNGGELQITDGSGNVLATVTASKKYECYIYSSPEITENQTIGQNSSGFGPDGQGGFNPGGQGEGGMRPDGQGGMRPGGQGGFNPDEQAQDGQQPPEFPSGETPSMPSGDRPELPSGEAPEMPSGDRPEPPSGQMPKAPSAS